MGYLVAPSQVIDLALVSQKVVALRIVRLLSGRPEAAAEASLIVREKIEAAHLAGLRLSAGGRPSEVFDDYLGRVKANLARLSPPAD